MNNNSDDNFVPQRQSFGLASSMNLMPQHLDIQAVVSTLSNASNVSLVKKTIQIFRNKYNSALDRSTLDTIEKLMIQQKHGLNVQIELIEVQRQYILALARLKSVGDDLEIEQLERDYKKADLRNKIKTLDNNAPSNSANREQRFKEDMAKRSVKIDIVLELEKEKRRKLVELNDDYSETYGDIKDWPDSVLEQYERDRETIIDFYDNEKMR